MGLHPPGLGVVRRLPLYSVFKELPAHVEIDELQSWLNRNLEGVLPWHVHTSAWRTLSSNASQTS